ncbi:hypothetical protein CALCODRAFT_428526, partial [Calocera cornea HHB12733]
MSYSTPSDIKDAPSSTLRIELLNADNWYGWKRCMQAILRERGLLKYTESQRIADWEAIDVRAQNQIELCVGDADMVHLIGAGTAAEMWSQLITVKEMRGEMGVMA